MGTVTIQEYTTKNPITMIGKEAGVCWGSDISNDEKNYKRGLDCLNSEHGRTTEFPDVYIILDGYSARVIREWYTHIGGLPTRLQASTRYIDYEHGFEYVTPPSIKNDDEKLNTYCNAMSKIQDALRELDGLGVPREDSAMLLPLAMTTTVVCKYNLRNLIEMSHQRMCTRAYWEFRQLFGDLAKALSDYSPEWETIVSGYFKSKCEYLGRCPEKKSCGRFVK